MKIACERCEKVMDAYFDDKYEKIRKGVTEIVLCKECYEKLNKWLYEEAEVER